MRELRVVECRDEGYEKEKDVQRVTEYVYITKPLLKLEIIEGGRIWNSFIARHGEAPLLREIHCRHFSLFVNSKLPSLKFVDVNIFYIKAQLEAPHLNYKPLNKKWYD